MAFWGFIFDLKRFTVHDGPGIRTTVFFQGCRLNCPWCQNPEGLEIPTGSETYENNPSPRPVGIREHAIMLRRVSIEALIDEIMRDEIFYDQSGGGVTVSGGEPLMQPAFLKSLLKSCKIKGIHTALDTSGYAAEEDFESICDMVDLFLYDLKIMDEAEHIRYTGVPNKQILENLKTLSGVHKNIVIRIPLIPQITDTDGNLRSIIDFLSPLEGINSISLLPYNRLCEDKYTRFNFEYRLPKQQTQSEKRLQSVSRLFEAAGYRVKIGG